MKNRYVVISYYGTVLDTLGCWSTHMYPITQTRPKLFTFKEAKKISKQHSNSRVQKIYDEKGNQ